MQDITKASDTEIAIKQPDQIMSKDTMLRRMATLNNIISINQAEKDQLQLLLDTADNLGIVTDEEFELSRNNQIK